MSDIRSQHQRLNRTSVGLKRALIVPAAAVAVRPQSNQRGIETGRPELPRWGRAEPQSNQRGIETFKLFVKIVKLSEPQSNQRGIETGNVYGIRTFFSSSLNRTSVGLKRCKWWLCLGLTLRPQSNQRGIETSSRASLATPDEVASIEPAWD